MNKIGTLGTELAMLIRREYEAETVLAEIRALRIAKTLEIRDADTGGLYTSTGEVPVVSDPVSPADAVTERFERRRNVDPIPYRADRTDGGNTFRLTPIADTVVNMPRPTLCAECRETFPHIHGEDGRIHAEV